MSCLFTSARRAIRSTRAPIRPKRENSSFAAASRRVRLLSESPTVRARRRRTGFAAGPAGGGRFSSGKPSVQVGGDEGIICQIAIERADAVYLAQLAGAQTLGGVKAPDARQQPLPPQDFVATGYTTCEIVRNVEYCCIHRSDLRVAREQIGGHGCTVRHGAAGAIEVNGGLRPDAPMSEQAAADAQRYNLRAPRDVERRHEIEDDVVIVAGIEGDALLGSCRDDPAQYVERTITVERRYLDADHVLNLAEPAPEVGRQRAPSDRGLKIEAEKRNSRGHGGRMRDQLILRGRAQG